MSLLVELLANLQNKETENNITESIPIRSEFKTMMDRLIPCGKRGVDTKQVNSPDVYVADDDDISDEDDDVSSDVEQSNDRLTIRQRLFACAGNTNVRPPEDDVNDAGTEESDSNTSPSNVATSTKTSTTFVRRLSTISLADHYTVVRKIGTGTFGSVLLCVSNRDRSQLALKKLPRATTKPEDFQREFIYSFRLSAHQSIVKTFDIAFRTRASFIFAQEFAPKGDLLRSVTPRKGLPECHAKTVARQIGSALEYMHSRSLVHRDVKPENILVFDDQLFRVKLADFGVAREVGTLVCKMCAGTAYTPPEICAQPRGRGYRVETSADVWAFGVVIFCILTGSFPWNLADPEADPLFAEFASWQTRRTNEVPVHWAHFSPNLMRLFRRLLECSPSRRPPVGTLFSYVDQPWYPGPAGTRIDGVVERSGVATRRTISSRRRPRDQTNCRSAQFDSIVNVLDECSIETSKISDRKSRVDRVNDWLLKQVHESLSVS